MVTQPSPRTSGSGAIFRAFLSHTTAADSRDKSRRYRVYLPPETLRFYQSQLAIQLL